MSESPRNRRIVEDDDVEVPVTKTKRVAVEEDADEAPRTRRVRPVEEEEDERPARKAKRPAEEESDEDSGPVGMDVDFGDTRIARRKGKLERLNLDSAKNVRFAILPGFKVKAAETHFIDGKGTFVCLTNEEKEGICCKKLGNPSLRALALVVQYTNAKSKDGTMPKDEDIEWEIKYIRMSRKNYNDIFALRTEDETVYDFDIVMHENEETNIGYKFRKISSRAWWRSDEALEKEILEAAEKFKDGKALSYYLGKKADDLEFKAMLREADRKGSRTETDEV